VEEAKYHRGHSLKEELETDPFCKRDTSREGLREGGEGGQNAMFL